jgi:hypothetical protein
MNKTDYTKQVLAGLTSTSNITKNFTKANNVPVYLAEGELAVNIIDKKLWVGNTLNTPVLLINPAAAAVALEGEVTLNDKTVTLQNSAVINKVLTGYTKSSGAIVSTDTILQAIQKLEGNVGMIDGGFPSDNYSNITTIDGGTP